MSVVPNGWLHRQHASAVLRDGTPVCVRAIRPDDKARLRTAFTHLSPRSVYRRFFHPVNELPLDDLRRLTERECGDQAVIVLTVGRGRDELLIAVGQYNRVPDEEPHIAEVAFTVIDDYQGVGAGALLLRELVTVARRHGVRRFTADVLHENAPMLEVFRRSGLPLRESMEHGTHRVTMDLAAAPEGDLRPAGRLRTAVRMLWRRFADGFTGARRDAGPSRGAVMHPRLQPLVSIVLLTALGVWPLPALAADAATPGDGAPRVVSYRDAVARAAPSVVTVYSAHASKSLMAFAPKGTTQGLGSGVIVDRDGYVVTNYHVVEEATQLAVVHSNGTIYPAQIIGADPGSDLALLKIDGDDLQPIIFADINDVAVGDVVLAVGNPFGIGQTVTQGIVGAIVRKGTEPVENFVQTDAAINPGNSGGALIDTAGRLIGINSVILTKSGGSEGIGFAIPGDLVQRVVATLKAKGYVARSWLGLTATTTPHGDGARVLTVERGGPADRAAIAPGDIIVRVGDKPVRHAQDVNCIVIGAEPGTHVAMDVVRSGKHTNVDVQLARVPGGGDR